MTQNSLESRGHCSCKFRQIFKKNVRKAQSSILKESCTYLKFGKIKNTLLCREKYKKANIFFK